ncbi:MAG: hypothetical protein ACE5PV_23855 [Candidatus Poribacteria bacterium]
MDCPNGCAMPMKQMKFDRIFYGKKGEPLVIKDLTMNVCLECGQESMPLKSARIVEDILNGKIKPIGQFTAVMYRAA